MIEPEMAGSTATKQGAYQPYYLCVIVPGEFVVFLLANAALTELTDSPPLILNAVEGLRDIVSQGPPPATKGATIAFFSRQLRLKGDSLLAIFGPIKFFV